MKYKNGNKDKWFWIEIDSNLYDIDSLLKSHSEFIINNYVAISCFDSGNIVWSDDELADGYKYYGSIPFTKKISNPWEIPSAGYDEWYLFEEPREFQLSQTFINYSGFSLHNDPSNMLDQFWTQLNSANPVKFIAQNGHFIFITQIENEYNILVEHLDKMN